MLRKLPAEILARERDERETEGGWVGKMDKAVWSLAVLLAVWAGWLDWRSRRIPNR
jgi:hypothetical protein